MGIIGKERGHRQRHPIAVDADPQSHFWLITIQFTNDGVQTAVSFVPIIRFAPKRIHIAMRMEVAEDIFIGAIAGGAGDADADGDVAYYVVDDGDADDDDDDADADADADDADVDDDYNYDGDDDGDAGEC